MQGAPLLHCIPAAFGSPDFPGKQPQIQEDAEDDLRKSIGRVPQVIYDVVEVGAASQHFRQASVHSNG